MPGDYWRMRANLRALYAYMWAHPGKKLLFMGGEIGQPTEWNEASELTWQVLETEEHRGIQRLVRDLNAVYRAHAALWEVDHNWDGFQWIDANDTHQSVAAFVRFAKDAKPKPPPAAPPEALQAAAGTGAGGASASAPETPVVPNAEGASAMETAKPTSEVASPNAAPKVGPHVVFVGSFTPVPRYNYRVGVPATGRYREAINTDAAAYGGSGMGNLGVVTVEPVPAHGFEQSVVLTLPPLSGLYLVPEPD